MLGSESCYGWLDRSPLVTRNTKLAVAEWLIPIRGSVQSQGFSQVSGSTDPAGAKPLS